MLRLLLKDGSRTWAPVSFLGRLGLFQKRPELLKSGNYTIKSAVSLDVLDLFFARVFGTPSPSGVTDENFRSLKMLCDEFGFDGFDSELEAVACGALTRGLKDRVDAHDVAIERLERQMLALRRQNEQWQRAFEQRLHEVSQKSQLGLERVENDLRSEVRDLDRQRASDFDKGFEEVKRELAGLKAENGKLGVCEKSLSQLRDEVSVLKDRESRAKSESGPDVGDIISFVRLAAAKRRVFAWLRKKEAILGRKMAVVRQSSLDIYGWLDPDSCDAYGSSDSPGAWIEIEFKAPVRVDRLKVTSSEYGGYPMTFDVTFSDGPGSDAKQKVSFVDEQGLKGTNRSVERKYDAVSA